MEQGEKLDLETRIKKLRSEGRTYRDIARIERVSISQISRILNPDQQPGEVAASHRGAVAAKVFALLEKKKTLAKIVISLQLEPEIVESLYHEWIKLRGADVNEPSLNKLKEELQTHLSSHHEIQNLLRTAKGMGNYRRQNCARVDQDGKCVFSTCLDKETTILRCAYCLDFELREEPRIHLIVEPQFPYYY